MSTTGARSIHPAEVAISLVLLSIGSFVIYETQGIAETQGYSQVGPRLFPYIIGTGLTLCGAVLGWHAIAGGWRASARWIAALISVLARSSVSRSNDSFHSSRRCR